MIQPSDYVEITGGYYTETFAPLPKEMIGLRGVVVKTGKMIDSIIEPGQQWGTYGKQTLREPVEELVVRVTTEGEFKGQEIAFDGIVVRKIPALETLAEQAEVE